MKRIILISILLCLGISVSNSWALTNCVGSYLNPWSKLKWTQCKGTYTWPDGEKYVGEYKDGEEHGQGTSTYANGDKYVGEYKDGRKHGNGTYTFADGRKVVGEWKDGKMHGQGTATSADGEKFVGEWEDGKMHGQGTYTWPSGSIYVGEWKDDNRNGQGIKTWHSGEKYVGEWKDGKMHGQGTLTYANGDKYVGKYKDGKEHGQGTFTYANGNKYVGEFLNGKFNGKGTLTYHDGTKKDGTWDNNEFLNAQKKDSVTSFDCSKAITETEIAICNDPELSALDELMSDIYSASLKQFDAKTGQKNWLKIRDKSQPEYSGLTNLEYLYYKYLSRITILMGQLNQRDVIKIFENNDYWELDHTSSETGFIFSHRDFQFLFVPSQNNTNAVFTEYSYLGGPGCERRRYSFSNETLLIKDSCNGMFFDNETYSYSDGYFFLTGASESYGRLQVYDGKILSLSGDYETGIAYVEQRVCNGDLDEPPNCLLDPTEFTYSFNNQKKFLLGSFSRDDLPHKNRPVNFEKTKPDDYFKMFALGKDEFKDDHSYPKLTDSVIEFFLDIQTPSSKGKCNSILTGYVKFLSGYTAAGSSFSNLRGSLLNDKPVELNLNSTGSLFSGQERYRTISLSDVLAFLDSYSATKNIISFWFDKLDKDTKRQLSLFSKYSLEYRQETGNLLNDCFGKFEKIKVWVPSSYKQKTGEETKRLWKPINEYVDGFWERRMSDGTADRVQSIFEFVAD